MNIVVVSLFDGMSCGRLAFDRVEGIKIDRYYSSEVDKYAIQISNKNYPQDKKYRLGTIVDVDGIQLKKNISFEFPESKIILIGGSPCQGFSLAGKQKGSSTKCGIDVVSLKQYLHLKKNKFEFDGQSFLFWEYIRIRKELQPDYFLLENVAITQKWLPMFSTAVGVNPIIIDSKNISAGNRKRYYWTNIQNISKLKKVDIKLNDILDNAYSNKDKSYCIYANYGKGSNLRRYLYRSSRQIVFTDINFMNEIISNKPNIEECNSIGKQHRDKWRFLTPEECEKINTVPVGYTKGVPKYWRYHMIGNGWTIDVISHIFRGLIADKRKDRLF